MAIGNQASKQIDNEVDWATMAGMLDLGDVLELVIDGLDDGTFAKQHDIVVCDQTALHVRAQEGDQLHTKRVQQLRCQFLADVALVTDELAEELSGQVRHRFAIIDIASCEVAPQELALIVDNQMQFEAKEPAHGGLASCCQTGEDLVPLDTLIATDSQRGRIDKRDARTATERTAKIESQCHQCSRHQLDESLIAYQAGKLSAQVFLDMLSVVALEVPIVGLMKMDQDGHDFTQTQTALPLAELDAAAQQMGLPLGLEFKTEIIDITEQFE